MHTFEIRVIILIIDTENNLIASSVYTGQLYFKAFLLNFRGVFLIKGVWL